MAMRPYGGGHGKACGHNACMCAWCKPFRRRGRRAARLLSAKKTVRREAREEIDMELNEAKSGLKVIFLDVDGVLNWAGTEDRIEGFIGLDPSRIERFNKLIEAHPDAKIVISSTWRKTALLGYSDFEGLKALLASRGLKGEIIGHTPIKMSYVSRGGEIRMWIEDWEAKNPGQELTFVILDDDLSGMASYPRNGDATEFARELRKNHVVTYYYGLPLRDSDTDEEGGLQDRHITNAIAILNGGKES